MAGDEGRGKSECCGKIVLFCFRSCKLYSDVQFWYSNCVQRELCSTKSFLYAHKTFPKAKVTILYVSTDLTFAAVATDIFR